MALRSDLETGLRAHLAEPTDIPALEKWLIAESRLPGPRANLELIYRTGELCRARLDLLPEFERWVASPTEPADPAEFLACAACVALGSLWATADDQQRVRIEKSLRLAANDTRWRAREGAAMGLQVIGEYDVTAMFSIVKRWRMADHTLLEQRAIVAALAHPPILRDPGVARLALDISEPITREIAALSPAARKTASAKVLVQGLSYALSVFVAALPEEGFAMLTRLTTVHDPLVDRVVAQNLEKKRLAKPFAPNVAQIAALLEANRTAAVS